MCQCVQLKNNVNTVSQFSELILFFVFLLIGTTQRISVIWINWEVGHWGPYFVTRERSLSLLPDCHVLSCFLLPHPSTMAQSSGWSWPSLDWELWNHEHQMNFSSSRIVLVFSSQWRKNWLKQLFSIVSPHSYILNVVLLSINLDQVLQLLLSSLSI